MRCQLVTRLLLGCLAWTANAHATTMARGEDGLPGFTLFCRRCGASVGHTSDEVAIPTAYKHIDVPWEGWDLGGDEQGRETLVLKQFHNPQNFGFNVLTLSKAIVLPAGLAQEATSFFPPYRWRIIKCPICGSHLGWEFSWPEICISARGNAHNQDKPNTRSKLTSGEKAKVDAILGGLVDRCIVTTRGYWSYEWCFAKHVRQYNVRKGDSISLGKFEKTVKESYGVSQHFVKGDWCDEAQIARSSTVKMVCCNSLPKYKRLQLEFLRVEENNKCNYTIIACALALCEIPVYRRHSPDESVNKVDDAVAKKYQKQMITDPSQCPMLPSAQPEKFYGIIWDHVVAESSPELYFVDAINLRVF